jgi:hypothetical protein
MEVSSLPHHPPVDIVIVNHMSADLVSMRLREIPPTLNVIIVDNSPEDEQVERIRSSAQRPLTIVRSSNRGFAAAVNLAAPLCGADFTLLLNPDASIAALELETLLSTSRLHSLDIASPVICNAYTGRVWFAGGRVTRFTYRPIHDSMDKNFARLALATPIVPTQFVSGCVLLISRRARDLLLPLREDLFMYWEDVDLSLRAGDYGLRRSVVTVAFATHAKAPGRSTLFYRYNARNRLIVARSRGRVQLLTALLTMPLVTTRQLIWLWRRESRRREMAAALIEGSIAGVRETVFRRSPNRAPKR